MASDHPAIVGGGMKKVLYTLQTVREIGVSPSTKALLSRNTCKACGLGMGGQRGGMTNELDEFPAVCNKSVQAQSTDIQPAIPAEIFHHTIGELKELDERELARLGRLNHPLHKPAGADRFRIIGWEEALSIAGTALKKVEPDRSFFYSSGRSSNEAGFIFQLLARLLGTNNVNNCSYYCHQATSVALASSIGTGTATVELADLTGCDLVFLVGANPASNHPRLLHQLKACRDRGGEVIVINPAREPGLVRFAVPKSPVSMITGGTWIASEYLQPDIGTDTVLLAGIAKAVLELQGQDQRFIQDHCLGFGEWRSGIDTLTWNEISETTGVSAEDIRKVAGIYCRSKNTVFAWGMGLTHHLNGVENIEQLTNLALLRGMAGRRFAGLLPLRGHSNVQGIGTIGVKPVLADDVIRSLEQHLDVSLPRRPGLDTMGAMQAAGRGEIDLAILMGGNLYSSNPDSTWAETALDRIRTRVYLTTTLNRGHLFGNSQGESIVFPVTARDEEQEATTQESMFNYVRLSDGGLHRLDNVRPESWILCELAKRALPASGFDFSTFQKHRTVRQAIAATIPGMEALQDIDVTRKEFPVRNRILHRPEFRTASGKASFRTLKPLPARPEDTDYPFSLTTLRSEGQFNSIVYEYQDSYRGVKDRWCILMNATDIAALDIEEGDSVDIASVQGVMHAVRVQAFDLPPGNCMAYYPEANVLTGTAVDPRSQTPAFKHTRIRIITGTEPVNGR